MDRRNFIRSGVAGAALAAGAHRAAATDLPNVLLIMCDQMRFPRWFPREARLPNLERLQERGLTFNRHYACAVPCSPSRACLFTGRHMDQNRVFINVRKKRPELDPAIPTLGHLFRQAGYKTPYFGKWHLSNQKPGDNLQAYGFRFQPTRTTSSYGIGTGIMNDPPVADAAAAYLHSQVTEGKPFFMTVSLVNPHDITAYPGKQMPSVLVPKVVKELPPNWDDDLAGKPSLQREARALLEKKGGPLGPRDRKGWITYLNYYWYLHTKMDALLGRVLDALDQTGLAKSTIVIFTSDHGEMGGSHRLRTKGPFIYRENTNIPLVLSWPGEIKKGVTTEALSQNVDLFPTLAEILGASAGHLPGKSLVPLFRGADRQLTDHVVFSYAGSDYLDTRPDDDDQPVVPQMPRGMRAVRTASAAYAHYKSPDGRTSEYELYDTDRDPLEMHNVASDPAYAQLRGQMAALLARAQATEMAPNK